MSTIVAVSGVHLSTCSLDVMMKTNIVSYVLYQQGDASRPFQVYGLLFRLSSFGT